MLDVRDDFAVRPLVARAQERMRRISVLTGALETDPEIPARYGVFKPALAEASMQILDRPPWQIGPAVSERRAEEAQRMSADGRDVQHLDHLSFFSEAVLEDLDRLLWRGRADLFVRVVAVAELLLHRARDHEWD